MPRRASGAAIIKVTLFKSGDHDAHEENNREPQSPVVSRLITWSLQVGTTVKTSVSKLVLMQVMLTFWRGVELVERLGIALTLITDAAERSEVAAWVHSRQGASCAGTSVRLRYLIRR